MHPALGVALNARAADDEDPALDADDLSQLAVGKVVRVSTPRGYGHIATDDGWKYYYQTYKVVGNPHVRLAEGDMVAFQPVTRERLKAFKKGVQPFPEVRDIRYLPRNSPRLRSYRSQSLRART